MTELLPCVEIDPDGPIRAAVIWLHGLGADGHDFEPIVPELRVPDQLGVRFVFPHAPAIAVTLNNGFVMPAWYDIAEIDLRRSHDEVGIRRSAAQLEALVARELQRGVPDERIVLAGFSQGGAVALFTALRHPRRLAGILALSTYLVGEDTLDAERSAVNHDVPIFMGHGTFDPMVALPRGEAARDALLARGYQVEFRTYPMAHAVHPREIADVGRWLVRVLADDGR
ncbi:MAG: dienelactone hydrolase family protein [Planctomycetes bacterium]|nr:dienelactone hydrolase family protein [Planctomycetota bacterium]